MKSLRRFLTRLRFLSMFLKPAVGNKPLKQVSMLEGQKRLPADLCGRRQQQTAAIIGRIFYLAAKAEDLS